MAKRPRQTEDQTLRPDNCIMETPSKATLGIWLEFTLAVTPEISLESVAIWRGLFTTGKTDLLSVYMVVSLHWLAFWSELLQKHIPVTLRAECSLMKSLHSGNKLCLKSG